MAEEKTIENLLSMTDLHKENLFSLQCLIKAPDIQCSIQYEFGKKEFLVFTTGNSNIIYYYKRDVDSTPIIRRVPWFQGSHKQILALCFAPLGLWLLCACADGSLYIIPALCLVDDKCVVDKTWNTDDVTVFPPIGASSSFSRPTAIAWWHDATTSNNVGIVGTEYGEVIFINLESGKPVGTVHVNGNVSSLNICHGENNDSVSLLITNQLRQQWRLLLEQNTYGGSHHLGNGESYIAQHLNESIQDNSKSFISTRARLQGLKQLSVEKLTILRQKLVETKNQSLGESLRYNESKCNRNMSAVINSEQCSEINFHTMSPEPISRDTFLIPQYDKDGRQLHTCYHLSTSHITVHRPDISDVPLSVHKIFESCKDIILTQKLFFVTDIDQQVVYVISNQLSKTHTNKDCTFNPDSIIGHFSFESNKENIHAVYKAIQPTNMSSRKLSQDVDSKYILPKKVKDLTIELPYIDGCIIVTNRSVYKIVLRKSLLSVFMELILKRNEPEKAAKLALLFGMNAQQLLEYAGDILLSNREFSRAVTSYKLSKCRLLKSVLKFASAGHTSELLSCLTHYLASPAISEIPVAIRIHLSNLCILAFIEITLRASTQHSKMVYKEFLYFLSTNTFYDELLAINVAGRTCLWEVLHHLGTQRGLYVQMLDILVKTIYSYGTNNCHSIPYGLLICLSDPNLMQAMLLNPELARQHINFVTANLPDSQIFALQRLITLYDPTSPILRPRLVELMCKTRTRSTSYSSQSSQCDSVDLTDDVDEVDLLVKKIVETFLLILLTLIHKKDSLNHHSTFIYNMQSLESIQENIDIPHNVNFKRRALSAGFSHVALIRNNDVYTWGSSTQGCLGTGPSVLRYGSPQGICFFRNMKLEVFSVSCGHCHTLAVTNNGVYAWGASQYGQLGLGKILQCSSPELITSLAQEVIVDAVAGQYHSVALTVDGRVFTWGWGVHGQLGHGNTNEKNTPTLMTTLLGTVICKIDAGHAHTLVLSAEGIVYAFGCNVFGQLGIGTNTKSSIPMKVSLLERISLIATGYFHNLAVSHTNKLYMWGSSPQVLRLQAQAQKRIRILEQQNNAEKEMESQDCENQKSCSTQVTNTNDEASEINIQSKCLQAKPTISPMEVQKKLSDSTNFKNINVGLLEEAQTHLKPSLVDLSLVKDQIIQISTGSHHNALVTKDGSVYTWGRNSDGQVGNGTRRELVIPTPLYYNSASIFVRKKNVDEPETHDTWSDDKNGNMISDERQDNENSNCNNKINSTMKAVGICCGYDYTVAIQPGGAVLAWGNNNRAQLGHIPTTKDTHDSELVLLKSSKRVVRCSHAPHLALDVPTQVPDISAPIISYQSYDVTSLAGFIQPLSVIEKLPGELTLHYILEYFTGLYDTSNVIEKCIELENYQACSKIAMLQHNIFDAFSYELKRLNIVSLQTLHKSLQNMDVVKDSFSTTQNLKKNTELFNKQVEKNLIESVENCAAKIRLKIPASKSLNSLQVLEQELYSFDCQGGSEELCKDSKGENTSLEISEDTFDSDLNTCNLEEWSESLAYDNDEVLNYKNTSDINKENKISEVCQVSKMKSLDMNSVNENSLYFNNASYENEVAYSQKNNLTNETIKVIKFYLNEMRNESDVVKYNILHTALDFWLKHNLSVDRLEHVLVEHVNTIFYPLGLLLFCQEIMEKYFDTNKNNIETCSWDARNLFSSKFYLQVCSMLCQYINEGHLTPEYIKLLSFLTADHYGPPLTGYPGSSGNSTSEEMMEGLISTITSENYDARSYVHIKDPDAVYRFLGVEEDTMVFTCGHHFPFSAYQTEIISGMETELLTTQSLLLPCTAQFLGKMLGQAVKPEIVCPVCVPRALGIMVRNTTNK